MAKKKWTVLFVVSLYALLLATGVGMMGVLNTFNLGLGGKTLEWNVLLVFGLFPSMGGFALYILLTSKNKFIRSRVNIMYIAGCMMFTLVLGMLLFPFFAYWGACTLLASASITLFLSQCFL